MLRRLAVLATLCFPALAQVIIIDGGITRMPHPPHPIPVRADCKIRLIDVHADVQDQTAKVRIEQVFQNPSSVPMEAQVFFPLPEGAAVSAMTLMVDGKEMTGDRKSVV